MNTQTEKAAQAVMKDGPRRVLVDEEGLSVDPRVARERYDVSWEFALIRDDGWSLGCQADLAEAAYDTWPDHWVAFVVSGDDVIRYMDEWEDREILLEHSTRSRTKGTDVG